MTKIVVGRHFEVSVRSNFIFQEACLTISDREL